MANKMYSEMINGKEVFVNEVVVDGRTEFEIRIHSNVGDKTFTTLDVPSAMVIKAIMAEYAVFVGEDPNVTLAVGFHDRDAALSWMHQLPSEDGAKAWMITTASYFGEGYRYL